MKYQLLTSGIIILLAGLATKARSEMRFDMSLSTQKPEETLPYPSGVGNSGVKKFKLANGMTVLLDENHSSPVVAVNVLVKVGSACEEEGEHGLAHVHEHMVFKGTKRRGVGEIARIIEGDGGDINAYTSYDQTVYYVEIASRFLDTALDVLSDAMENATFDPQELSKELEVIVEEIRRGEDSPTRKLSELLFKEAFTVHPYKNPIIGTKESVRSFNRDKVLSFYKKWYAPSNMVLVVVGDFNTQDVMPKIEKTFGAIRGRSVPTCTIPAEPPQEGTRAFVATRDVHEGYFALGFHTAHAMSEDTPVLDVIASILGGGNSSRLYRRVKEEAGLVNNIYAYSYTPKYAGLFVIGGSLDPGKVSGGIPEVIRQTYLLRSEPVTQSELQRAKVNIESESIYAKETMNGQAEKLGYFEAIAGDYRYEQTYLERVRSVTPEDIVRVANKYFRDENLTIGVLFPKEQSGVTKEDILRLVREGSSQAPVGAAAPEGLRQHKETRVVLENGIRVIVKEGHAVPIFAARAAFLGGLRYETEETNGLSNFLSEMLTRGTKRRTSEDIAREIESIAGSLDGYSGRNSFGVTLEALSGNFDEAMEIFSDVILNSTFPDEEIERARKDILSAINIENDNLLKSTVNLFLATLYKGHPYRFRTLGTKENVSRFKRDDLVNFYKRLVKPENMVIAVVGDVETDEVIKTVKRLFGGMQKGTFSPARLEEEPKPDKIRTASLTRRDKEQTHIILGFLAPSVADPDLYPMEVLNSILSGQGGRLFLELRDRQSLAYSVASFYTPGLETGFMGVYIGTAPQKREEAIEGIKAQLKALLDNGVTDEEVARAQNYLVGSFEIGLQKNSAQTARLAFDELYGLGWDDYKRYAERIYAVRKEDVLRVARRYIDLERYVLAVLTPEERM